MTSTSVPWSDALADAATLLHRRRPVRLLPLITAAGEIEVTQDELDAYLAGAETNSPGIPQLHTALARWDIDESEDLTVVSAPQTLERRNDVYKRLGLSASGREALNRLCPPNTRRQVVISKKFEPWYVEGGSTSTMYWDHYLRYLSDKRGLPGSALSDLKSSTFEIVRRLADPTRREAKQTKGLVVGYVQSGKTANFTGVVARAIDAGYRLVIVLTGTIEILRSQTQRRIDMELVGRENILAGRSEDAGDDKEFDYRQDPDWVHKRFVEHGEVLKTGHAPPIMRVTTRRSDYKRLPDEVSKLRFKRHNKAQPLNHPENLANVDAYVAIVKKNKAALKKLIDDLRPLGETLDELPVLIIDDESDQASVDTTNPKKKTDAGERRRTAINKQIGQILQLCRRAQYIGYTATPFANVFIDPDDDSDLFPSDFLLSLPRPTGYMGVQEFHDVGKRWDDEDRTFETSNELAHVRPLFGAKDDPEETRKGLREAIEAFVLSGALKKYRQAHSELRFRHHTMIVHESMYTDEAGAAAEIIRGLWREGRFTHPDGLQRLRRLYESDFHPVSTARAPEYPNPQSFDELKPFIGEAISQITAGGERPYLIVNSDKDLTAGQQELDFQQHDVWRILVGGTQLSRGFTVEGLTVSYYRRKTGQADTLMQAGRWFGFRTGYQDLVRLYIRRDDDADLYAAFEALLLDEEDFRSELERYSGFDADGMPLLEPRAVPPLVTQRLPWLSPTARNKMWNAEIQQKVALGSVEDFSGVPRPQSNLAESADNFGSVAVPLIRAAKMNPAQRLAFTRREGDEDRTGTVKAQVGRMSAHGMSCLLTSMRWHERHRAAYGRTMEFLRRAGDEGLIDEWAVVWPQPMRNGGRRAHSSALDFEPAVVTRGWRDERDQFFGSDRKHANTLADVASGLQGNLGRSSTRGALLLYLAAESTAPVGENGRLDADSGWVSTIISLYVPHTLELSQAGPIKWRVLSNSDSVAIDRR